MDSYKLGWFSTGRDKAARDLLTVVMKSIARGEIEAEIAFVFCNREPEESKESDLFLKLVESYRLSLVYFSSKKFQSPNGYEYLSDPWRLEYDREVMERLARFHPDLCVLAGYMLIAGEEMCQQYNMINLHPAAPGGPQGSWQEVIWQLIEKRARETGAMMHLVTPELDKGPPVTYCTFLIKDDSNRVLWEQVEKGRGNTKQILFWEIRRRGLQREFPLIVSTLKAFSESKVSIVGGRIIDNTRGKVINGYNLTEEINAAIKGEI